MQNIRRVVLAFSGGLDTSFCVPWLRERGWEVHTVFVDTGGTDPPGLEAVRLQAMAIGAASHHLVDARQTVYDRFIRYLIQGNMLRGEVYPLSVAAERTQQATSVIELARRLDAGAVAHGSTGAGNDQVRFDVAFRVLAPELEILTPIRDEGLTRGQAIAYLRDHSLPVPEGSGAYSVNRGGWGTTWGGGWTHDTWQGPPDDLLEPPADAPEPVEIVIAWDRGVPTALDGQSRDGPALIAELGARTIARGIGRGIHVGETALGIKGRIGFEAGAALVLIAAHRELEKITLTRWQVFWKDQLARFYGDRLHEGQYFDPCLRDIEMMIASSQRVVTGDTRVRLAAGRFHVVGTRSPNSLMDPSVARYGEDHSLWSGEEARAFARVTAIPSLLAERAARATRDPDAWS